MPIIAERVKIRGTVTQPPVVATASSAAPAKGTLREAIMTMRRS